MLFGMLALFASAMFALPALAGVQVTISRATQRMTVSVDGAAKYTWAVSTGSSYGSTRAGTFHVQSMKRMHYSSKYNNAPMPHSIFYDGDRAIHGTTHVGQLGNRASHGCVRLAPGNAAALFALVQKYGTGSVRIIVQ